jgi:hypothetical protein
MHSKLSWYSSFGSSIVSGRAMAQAVSRRPLKAKARVSRSGSCGGQRGTGTGFSPSSSRFPCHYHCSMVPTHISFGGWKIGPLVVAVKRRRLTPLIWTTRSAFSPHQMVIPIWFGLFSLYNRPCHGSVHGSGQVRSGLTLTAEARVRALVNSCGICGGQSYTGTGFSRSSSVFPCQYIIPPSLSKLLSSGECVIC